MMFRELRYTNQTNTPAGRLCSKLQDFTATANTYAYSQNAKPHAVRRIYNGLTELTDALAVVVSEQTGAISLVEDGNIHYNIAAAELRETLEKKLTDLQS